MNLNLYRLMGLTALLLALTLLPATVEANFRCDGKIIQRGDRSFEVRRRCGEPDAVVPLHSVHTVQHGYVPTREEWQYNLGPHRLMRFLVFQNGRLSRIQTGNHGFGDLSGSCRPGHLVTGMSQIELQARCGEPAERELRITHVSYRVEEGGKRYKRGLPAEDWLYDFGSNRFLRIVTLIHGRVVNIEQSSSRGSP